MRIVPQYSEPLENWQPVPAPRPKAHQVSGHVQFNHRKVLAIALCSAVGLASVAVADAASRRGYSYNEASVFFWLGLLIIFAPIAGRSLSQGINHRERLVLIILLGVAFYLVKVLASPGAFTFSDEYTHLRSTQDILLTHHLFAFNPLLPTASYYPGLAAITAGLVDLTGFSPFVSGLLIIGVARVVFSASFFFVAEAVTKSDRAAAGASLIYAANPMFLFWSAAFSYENLALPLAAFTLWWIGRTRHRTDTPALAAAVISVIAITLTHHVVGFALSGVLGMWWLAGHLNKDSVGALRRVGLMAIISSAFTLTWFFLVAKPAPTYLISQNLVPALRQTGSLLLGHTAPRRLYTSGGLVSPRWESVAGFAAVGALILALIPALLRAWASRRRTPLAVATCLAVAYPLSLIPRLAPNGVAISGRSSEYVFAGMGCLIGLLIAEPKWRRTLRHIRRTWRTVFVRQERAAIARHRTLFAGGLVTLVLVGDVTIGTAFYEQLPESSHPSGYPWLVQQDTISASQWALDHLGPNNRFGADTIDSFALASFGEQDPVVEGRVWPIFFARTMNSTVANAIRSTGIRYLLVDWRMTRGVPPTPGYYFSANEPGGGQYKHEFPAASLRKFSAAPCTQMVYHSGAIEIFNVSQISNGSCIQLEPRRKGSPQ